MTKIAIGKITREKIVNACKLIMKNHKNVTNAVKDVKYALFKQLAKPALNRNIIIWSILLANVCHSTLTIIKVV